MRNLTFTQKTKKKIILFMGISFVFLLVPSLSSANKYPPAIPSHIREYEKIKLCIQYAYPEFSLDNYALTSDVVKNSYLVPTNVEPTPKNVILFATTKPRPQEEILINPSLLEVFSQQYPTGKDGRFPKKDENPGRLRNCKFLHALYGIDLSKVKDNLISMLFVDSKVQFMNMHGAAEALEKVTHGINTFLEKPENAHYKEYIIPNAGTFAWRFIAQENRLSPHSFGIAIDVAKDKNTYWRWKPSPKTVTELRNEFPQEVVDIFEKNGFIWGGKWDAYDFMHFEYRPELFCPK